MLTLILIAMLQVWKEKAKGLKLDYEMKMLNMKNKEKDDQEAGKFYNISTPLRPKKIVVS